jgi:DNA-binding phage protein
MKLQSIRDLPSFNIIDYLKSEEDIAGYMQAVLEDGDAELLAAALLDVEEARRTL